MTYAFLQAVVEWQADAFGLHETSSPHLVCLQRLIFSVSNFSLDYDLAAQYHGSSFLLRFATLFSFLHELTAWVQQPEVCFFSGMVMG